MKKVIFGKASSEVIHADDVGNYSIIGYRTISIRGVIAWNEGEQRWRGVSLANGPLAHDKKSPSFSMALESRTAQLSGFLKMCQTEHPYTQFYKFDDMEDCLGWLLHGE